MKKVLKTISLIFLSLLMIMPTTAYAEEEIIPEWEDISLTEEEIDKILSPYEIDNSKARTTGLIVAYGMAIQKSGSNLLIVGKTYGDTGVTKCGFTVVTVQRKKSTSSSWSTYTSYSDLYSSSTVYSLTKTITPPSGYQYRVTCTHYAKKSILSTEKIPNTSNTVTM